MAFVAENELLERAEKGGYAVPGFFPFNMDFIKPIIEVAEEERSPIVLLQGPEFIESFGPNVFTQALITAAHYAKVPVTLALDHPFVTDERSISHGLRAISLGWKSIMLDGSLLPYEQNMAMTKEMSAICHKAGVSCLGALGEVRRFFPQAMNYPGAFPDDFVAPPEIMTDPAQAEEFVKETQVDSLAISAGQYVRSLWDGELPPYKRTASLDLKRIEEIRARTGAHLVLHGSTHVKVDSLKESIKCGVSMIKVASEQALIWSNTIRKTVTEQPDLMFPEDIQKPALAAVKESMRNYIRMFNSAGKA